MTLTISDPPVDALDAAGPTAPLLRVRFRERVRSRVGVAELLVVRVGEERYAFDVCSLDEVLDAPRVEYLPRVDSAMCGITMHLERPLPLFDLSQLLGMPRGTGGTVLVMRALGQRVGLLVNDVIEVRSIVLERVQPPPFDCDDELLLGVAWSDNELTAIMDARGIIAACQPEAEGIL